MYDNISKLFRRYDTTAPQKNKVREYATEYEDARARINGSLTVKNRQNLPVRNSRRIEQTILVNRKQGL